MKQQRRGGFLLARVHQLGGRVFARKLREHGVELNPAQGRIMFALWQYGSMPIMDLARRTSLGKSTLTSMLDRLEHSGYITRVPDPHDRRRITIELTEKDRSLHRLYEQVSDEMTDLFYQGFSPSRITRFEEDLQTILANLERHDTGGSCDGEEG